MCTCYLPFPLIWVSIKGLLTWTGLGLPSFTPCGVVPRIKWERKKRFRKNVTLAGLSLSSQCRPTQATTGHGLCLCQPAACAWEHMISSTSAKPEHSYRYHMPIYLYCCNPNFLTPLVNDEGFSSFPSPSILFTYNNNLFYG